MAELTTKQLNGTTAYVCPDCGRWAYVGEKINHSKRCDHPTLQATVVLTQVAKAPAHRETKEEYVQRLADSGQQVQPKDWDLAMNRDF